MTPPQTRNKENGKLPARWRLRYGFYWYRVPPEMREHWDGKKEFKLGSSLAEAHRTFSSRITAIEGPLGPVSDFPTMAHVFDHYLITITPTKAKATQRPERQMIGKLRELWGEMAPTDMTPVLINRVKHITAQQISPETANHHLRILSAIFTAAIEWGAIGTHPMVGKKVTKLKIKKKEHRIPTDEEIDRALTVAPDLIIAYVEIKRRTGLRQTDMLKIERGDIRDGKMRVTIQKTEGRTGKTLVFDLTPDLEHWVKFAQSVNRHRVQSLYLFQTRDGKPYIDQDDDASSFHSAWQRWQKKVVALGVEKFAERYLRNKVGHELETDEAAQQLLGHEHISTTRAFYRSNESNVTPLDKSKHKGNSGENST